MAGLWIILGRYEAGEAEQSLTALAEPQEWFTIARRPRAFNTPDTSAGDAAIEAPFIFKKDSLYYLFVSTDYCCRAEKSDYKVVVAGAKALRALMLTKQAFVWTRPAERWWWKVTATVVWCWS
jgi:arabinan endo-1,5-alpha-L-arabinosidase